MKRISFCKALITSVYLTITRWALTYGLRGMAYFFVSVQCACKDLHSGVYGGAVSEAMTDLVNLMSSLVDNKGKILVPGIYDMVAPVSEDEKLVYPKLDFDPEHFNTKLEQPN